MKNIVTQKFIIEDVQKDQLRTLFSSPAYGLLREVIAAHCAEHQVDFVNKTMYDNENARAQAMESEAKARRFNSALNVLDDIEKIEDQWFRISLEQRR